MDTRRNTATPPRRRRPQQNRRAPSRPQQRQTAPAVNYTPPMPISRKRVLLSLATVVALVAAVAFGVSIFFKVKNVTVSGAERYTAWEIRQASGIQEGDSLMTLSKERIAGNIRATLPYVKRVRVGRTLPDTVNIEIEEEAIAYAIKSAEGSWWLMSASGHLLSSTDNAEAAKHTVIKGVTLESPAVGSQAVAAQVVPTTGEGEETHPVTMTAAAQLGTVLEILQQLENNGVLGKIASVDVTDMGDIELWYSDRYQIRFGDQNRVTYKVNCMARAIAQLADYESGVLDVSFTIWPEEVGYTPFG